MCTPLIVDTCTVYIYIYMVAGKNVFCQKKFFSGLQSSILKPGLKRFFLGLRPKNLRFAQDSWGES